MYTGLVGTQIPNTEGAKVIRLKSYKIDGKEMPCSSEVTLAKQAQIVSGFLGGEIQR